MVVSLLSSLVGASFVTNATILHDLMQTMDFDGMSLEALGPIPASQEGLPLPPV